MRKSVLVGLVAAGAMSTSFWHDRLQRRLGPTVVAATGYYGYDAPRVHRRLRLIAVLSTGDTIVEYRPAYYYDAAYYRPAVWGWRSWGEPQWSYRAGWRRWMADTASAVGQRKLATCIQAARHARWQSTAATRASASMIDLGDPQPIAYTDHQSGSVVRQ